MIVEGERWNGEGQLELLLFPAISPSVSVSETISRNYNHGWCYTVEIRYLSLRPCSDRSWESLVDEFKQC